MEQLYKLEGQELIPAPQQAVVDGKNYLNFPVIAGEHGYKPLRVDAQPTYNPLYQRLEYYYEELDDCNMQRWRVVYSMSLDMWKTVKIAELNKGYKNKQKENFVSQGYTFSYSDDAQKNFTKVTAMFNVFPDRTHTPWITVSHGMVLLTKEQFFQVLLDLEDREWYLMGMLVTLESQVFNAKSYEAVDAVVWE